MSLPLISIVIPTYNCDRYLSEAIDSVLNQDVLSESGQSQNYSECEVIVIDDGSLDGTPEILQRYGKRIRAVRQTNQGVSVARNHGIQLAQGKWVAFLDADDFLLPDQLGVRMAVAESQPGLGMIHSGWYRVNSQGHFLMAVEPWHQIPRLNLESWLRWKPVLPSAMLFRRDWLLRSGGFDRRFPPAEDTDLVLRLSRMGCEAGWLKQITVGYRQHENSAMHQGLPQARSLAAVIDHFFAQPDLPESIRWIEPQVRYNTLVWIAWYLYYTGHRAEMTDYLRRSLPYSSYSLGEVIVHWADSFTTFSNSWGSLFDAEELAQSAEWQGLIKFMRQNS
ncbi:MAG: glycosyltransferase [Leptolyngbyaceae cyanobacterium CRU_2_3]|nr:glycosyltransferase [Leptolyngbyaceae cyanobacterium CRU_2_3]